MLTEFASLFDVHNQSVDVSVCNCESYSCQWGRDSQVGPASDGKARCSTDAGLSPQCNDNEETLSKNHSGVRISLDIVNVDAHPSRFCMMVVHVDRNGLQES